MATRKKCAMCGGPGQFHTADCSAVRAKFVAEERQRKIYNGWANYETWCVNLWIDNEQALHEERRERVREIIRTNVDTDGEFDRDSAVGEVAKWLESWIEADIPETFFPDTVDRLLRDSLGPYCDLLRAAYSEVDWHEIAEHDVDDEKDEILAEVRADAAAETDTP